MHRVCRAACPMKRAALLLALVAMSCSPARVSDALAQRIPTPTFVRWVTVPPAPAPGTWYSTTTPLLDNAGTCDAPDLRPATTPMRIRWRWDGVHADSSFQTASPGDTVSFYVPASAESVWVRAERDGMPGCVLAVGSR